MPMTSTKKTPHRSSAGRIAGGALVASMLTVWVLTAVAQDHAQHEHGEADNEPVSRPRIFLDKSPRIVAYQLGRLDNERLLLVERSDDDPKYAPVHAAILSRAGMSPQYREEALAALVKINESDATSEVLAVLDDLDEESRQEQRTANELTSMLLAQPHESLVKQISTLSEAAQSDNPFVRRAALAGLITAGAADQSWELAQSEPSTRVDWLAATMLTPSLEQRASLRELVTQQLAESEPVPVRRAAIRALARIPSKQAETFQLVAPLLKDGKLRADAVKTLLAVPQGDRDVATSKEAAAFLVSLAEKTPAAKRTTDQFLTAMQLADQLLARLPTDVSRGFRDRLREVTVRVVIVRTVNEEMRYDTPFFAVEAGRPVQVVLANDDLMPHNLVLTAPGKLKEVADLGLEAGPTGTGGKAYVPDSEFVLEASGLVEPNQQERLTFTAPSTPGEYPYVCTFPRHWMRMYGVMVVVPDLDAWQKNPTTPKDPIGSDRRFVKSWKVDDLKDSLEEGLRGRSPEIGARLFAEATCIQCHKLGGQGGAVGPELSDVLKRWKGDHVAVLREILEPSHRIDPKYAVHVILRTDGRTVSGIVAKEDRDSLSILVNPEAKEPLVIPRSEIEETVKTSVSMMPKALLDRFTKDEILELLAYVASGGKGADHAHHHHHE